jgi:hypothetical protein
VFDTDSPRSPVEFAAGTVRNVINSIVSRGFCCKMSAPVQKDGVGWFVLMMRSTRGCEGVGEGMERRERDRCEEDEVRRWPLGRGLR